MKILFLLLVAVSFSILKGLIHRSRARRNDEPTASLSWHVKQAYADIWERLVQKKQSWENLGVEKENSRRESMTVLEGRLQEHDKAVGDAVSNLRTGRGKKKNSKARHHHSPRESSSIAPESSAQKIEEPVIAIHSTGALGSIRFTYAQDGAPSERQVDVQAFDANYLKGYCGLRREIRTFRFDRIVGKITCLDTGEVMTSPAWKRQARKYLEERPAIMALSHEHELDYLTSGYLAIYFSGFRANHRENLERVARADARYKVRNTLDASVDVLIAGPLTGERQLNQAAAFNIRILDEEGFLMMMGNS